MRIKLNVRERAATGVLAALLALPAMASAQTAPAAPPAAQAGATPPAADSHGDLAKQLANPVAALVSVPFQFNWAQPVGPDKDSQFVLNVQPVIPWSISEDWNLILRWIMPYIGQPPLSEGGAPASGMGDIVTSVFLSPSKPGRFIWGVGPVFMLPTNSNALLGSSKWAAGPTFVVLKQSGGWSYGVLANWLFSFAGDDVSGGTPRGNVNVSFVNPFISYATKSAITIGLAAEMSGNWRLYDYGSDGSLTEKDGTQWTVPITLTVSKVTKFGPLPMSVACGVSWFASAPGGQPDWRLRLGATILLPRK
jgi:hypothetical protein